MIRSPTVTQNFTLAKLFCPHHLQAPHCHWDSWLHFADAETEAWQVVVTEAAGSRQGEVQTPPLWLSESDGTTPFPCPLCFLTPRLGTSPPVLGPPPGRSDWPAWVTCPCESQSTVGGLALFTNGTSRPNSIRSLGKAVSQNDSALCLPTHSTQSSEGRGSRKPTSPRAWAWNFPASAALP